jgi:hypothetical protein
MKRCSLVAAVVALASLASLVGASRAAIQTQVRFPIGDSIFDPCTGEVVDLSGTAHVVFSMTTNGNHGSLMFHDNDVSTGVGETTGALYVLVGNFSDHIEGTFVNGQFTQTTVIRNLRLITAGGSNNAFAFDDTFHVTANANGNVTVEFDHLTPNGCV